MMLIYLHTINADLMVGVYIVRLYLDCLFVHLQSFVLEFLHQHYLRHIIIDLSKEAA
jgi:hypothetical protein